MGSSSGGLVLVAVKGVAAQAMVERSFCSVASTLWGSCS